MIIFKYDHLHYVRDDCHRILYFKYTLYREDRHLGSFDNHVGFGTVITMLK